MPLRLQSELKTLSHRDQLGTFLAGLGLKGTIVEVGTLGGDYADVLLRTWPGEVHCVDPWMNQPESVYFDGANKANFNQVFAGVRRRFADNPRCKLLRMFSANAVGLYDDGELAAVYLDGNHALPYVRGDMATWWPKIKIGGMLCGHDFYTRYDQDTNSDAQTAVMEFAEIIGVQPNCNWCTSWYFIKTEEADKRFREANLDGRIAQPVYSDNTKGPLVVVLPVARFDYNLALKWLAWAAALAGKSTGSHYHLLVWATPELTDEQFKELEIQAKAITEFAMVVSNVGLVEQGYFGTCNLVFRSALEYCEKHFPGQPILWAEADAIPLRPSWAAEILDEYRTCLRPFMGDFYRNPASIPHMTGNAVFHPNWRKYAPGIAQLKNEECGFDTLLAFETMPRAHQAKTIQQIWRPPLPITSHWAVDHILESTALFHQCKDGSLIDVLCLVEGLPPIPLQKALCESTYATQQHGRLVADGFPTIVDAPAPKSASLRSFDIPSMEIMIVTFARDIPFLKYCLDSIKKYASGFAGVTLVVPSREDKLYGWVDRSVKIRYFEEPEGKGMMAHEVQICRADEHCPNVQSVLFMDADCMFFRKATPAAFAPQGRLLSVRESYDKIVNPNRFIWRVCLDKCVGIIPKYDFMVRHPQVHTIDVFRAARVAVEHHTGKPFDEYVLSCQNTFPQGFCEFGLLGNIAERHFPDRYEFVDYDHQADAEICGLGIEGFQYLYRRDRDFCVEWWSHGGLDRYKSAMEAILAGRIAAYWVK